MTKRQRNKLDRFENERRILGAYFEDACERGKANIVAIRKALNRYDHHHASAHGPSLFIDDEEGAREGRFHIYWMRLALRQAADLLGVPRGV